MNSAKYQEVLESNLLPFIQENSSNDLIYQQDNASIHVSSSTRQWFSSNNIPLLDWPAVSPDLNPIENVWGLVVRHVYADNRQFSSNTELKVAIVRAWESLDKKIIRKLYDSMQNRIFEVINLNGAITKY